MPERTRAAYCPPIQGMTSDTPVSAINNNIDKAKLARYGAA
jgi:hypothetical protein